eukprot:11683319-Prorocentrum_lima.AAC.1
MSRANIGPFMGLLQRHAYKPSNKHFTIINSISQYCKNIKTGMHCTGEVGSDCRRGIPKD